MIEPIQILFGYVLGIASGFGVALFIGYKKDKVINDEQGNRKHS